MQVSGSCGANSTAMAQMRDRQFSRADSDRSGALSLEEFASAARRGPAAFAGGQANSAAAPADPALRDAFRSLDSNGDGQVSAAEMAAARQPSPPSDGFDSASFAALLGSQSDSGQSEAGGRAGEHRHHQRHSGETPPNPDSTTQRLLSAYNARQPTTPATAITA